MCLERLRSISPAGDHIHRTTSCQCKDRRDYCLFRFDLKWEKWHIWSRIIMWPLKKINFHSVTESGQLSDYTKNIIRGLNRYFSWIWPFLPLSLMRITRELSFLCCNDRLIRMSPDEETPPLVFMWSSLVAEQQRCIRLLFWLHFATDISPLEADDDVINTNMPHNR